LSSLPDGSGYSPPCSFAMKLIATLVISEHKSHLLREMTLEETSKALTCNVCSWSLNQKTEKDKSKSTNEFILVSHIL